MVSLKEARKKGKLDKFIREHEKDEPADSDKFDATLSSLSQGKSKPTQGTSGQGDS